MNYFQKITDVNFYQFDNCLTLGPLKIVTNTLDLDILFPFELKSIKMG